MKTIRIAQAQINPTVGDIRGNVNKIVSYIKKARSLQSDIVTFPELAICGYPPEDLLLRKKFLKDNLKALEAVTASCEGIIALVGFANSNNDRIFNSAALIHNREVVKVYNKLELPNYGVFDEKRYFTSGDECLGFVLDGVRICVTICEDIWIYGSRSEAFAFNSSTDVTLNISASPFCAGKYELRKQVVRRFARATGSTVCFNNLIGGQDELVFDGGSLVIAPDGTLISSGNRFTEDLLVTDLTFSEDQASLDATTKPACTISLSGNLSEYRPAIQSGTCNELSMVEEVYEALKLGIRDYCLKNRFSKTVIGLSGGIDSALTAAIACDALGAENVTGVTMPSRFTSRETLSDAGLVAKRLGIRLISAPIEGILKSFMQVLGETLGDSPPGIEYENLQARIRGGILMTLSNRFNWLVITTGNKSETAVGYCTLYGDMAGGFALIKDVPKTLVYDLSHYINKKCGTEIIPSSTIERPPSAELRPDQKDEDSLPPYSILDPILKAYVENDQAPDEIEGYDRETVKIIAHLVDINEYKRRQGPPGVKITPKAFGRDRRLPITNRYNNMDWDG